MYEPTIEERKSENLAQEIEEEHIERLSPFAFSKCKIPIGAMITFVHQGNANSGVQCTVVDDKSVEYQGRRLSLSALATELTGSKWSVAGPRYFKYNGAWLNELRAKEEGWQITSRLDDVRIIPCNPKYYDIVAAFDDLDVIEWSQSTNTTVGDTVYILVININQLCLSVRSLPQINMVIVLLTIICIIKDWRKNLILDI